MAVGAHEEGQLAGSGRDFRMTIRSALGFQDRKREALNLACRQERGGHPKGRNGMSRCPWHILEEQEKGAGDSPAEGELWGAQSGGTKV